MRWTLPTQTILLLLTFSLPHPVYSSDAFTLDVLETRERKAPAVAAAPKQQPGLKHPVTGPPPPPAKNKAPAAANRRPQTQSKPKPAAVARAPANKRKTPPAKVPANAKARANGLQQPVPPKQRGNSPQASKGRPEARNNQQRAPGGTKAKGPAKKVSRGGAAPAKGAKSGSPRSTPKNTVRKASFQGPPGRTDSAKSQASVSKASGGDVRGSANAKPKARGAPRQRSSGAVTSTNRARSKVSTPAKSRQSDSSESVRSKSSSNKQGTLSRGASGQKLSPILCGRASGSSACEIPSAGGPSAGGSSTQGPSIQTFTGNQLRNPKKYQRAGPKTENNVLTVSDTNPNELVSLGPAKDLDMAQIKAAQLARNPPVQLTIDHAVELSTAAKILENTQKNHNMPPPPVKLVEDTTQYLNGKSNLVYIPEEHNLAKGHIADLHMGISDSLPDGHNRAQAINALEKTKGTIRAVSQHLDTLAESHGYKYPAGAGFVDTHESMFKQNDIARGFEDFEEVEERNPVVGWAHYWSRQWDSEEDWY
ncbi:hypothetical protein FA15DRAFT_734715 [Coprinopsis marcescibilis]|uniref:Uncharacterized protein n=1 Tax=Coprinopsis marcescibilis TaxID=230819 RepID=A0A5C3KZ48_COPMA|nr:hypothetical protein FA15DRAFT_734715 [Coprinopsis marcescibilis]